MKVVFSEKAKADLLDIAHYIASDNPVRARSFVDELEQATRRLGAYPASGAPGPVAGDLKLRVLVHGRYLVLYSVGEDPIRIERVLHGSRDLVAALCPD